MADRAGRGQDRAQLLIRRVAADADLLRRRQLDRVGPLQAGDLIKLPVGRQLQVRLTVPAPVVNPARRVAEPPDQQQLALIQRPRFLGVDPRPLSLDLVRDRAVGRLGRAAVDLQRGRVHVQDLVVVAFPGGLAQRIHVSLLDIRAGGCLLAAGLARASGSRAGRVRLPHARSVVRPGAQNHRDQELPARPRMFQGLLAVAGVGQRHVQQP